LSKIDKSVQELRRLTADNAAQQRRLDTLEPLIKNRVAFAIETVDAFRSKGEGAAVQLIETGKGKAWMDDIHKTMDQMESEERDLLKKRADAADNDAVTAKWTIALGTFAAIVLAT